MFENRTDFKFIIIKIIKKDVLKIPPVPKRQLLYYYEILAWGNSWMGVVK